MIFQILFYSILVLIVSTESSTRITHVLQNIGNSSNLTLKRDASSWPLDTFAFSSLSTQMYDVRIKLNEQCISSNRNGDLFLNGRGRRNCDRWEVVSEVDGYVTIKNTDYNAYLTANIKGDAFTQYYTGRNNQLWFLATNLKSTRLFNRATSEYIDSDQSDKVVTSPFYGRFQRSNNVIVINNSKSVLNIDSY